jgi:hypothetical protein
MHFFARPLVVRSCEGETASVPDVSSVDASAEAEPMREKHGLY